MPTHRRSLGDLSPVPVTTIQEADVEGSPSSSLSKPLLDNEYRFNLGPEQPTHNGHNGDTVEDQRVAEEEKDRFVTTILINLSAIMERTDEQLLPAVYRFVGASFQVSGPHQGSPNKRAYPALEHVVNSRKFCCRLDCHH
jgi:hypothetical protein